MVELFLNSGQRCQSRWFLSQRGMQHACRTLGKASVHCGRCRDCPVLYANDNAVGTSLSIEEIPRSSRVVKRPPYYQEWRRCELPHISRARRARPHRSYSFPKNDKQESSRWVGSEYQLTVKLNLLAKNTTPPQAQPAGEFHMALD